MIYQYIYTTYASLKNSLLGSVLIIVGILIFFWSRNLSNKETQKNQEGSGLVTETPSSPIDQSKEGKLIYTNGKIKGENSMLRDEDFGIEVNALILNRTVEMYQWKENESTNAKTKYKSYNYRKLWSEELISSANFNKKETHQNPSSLPYNSFQKTAQNIKLGDYSINEVILSNLRKQSESINLKKLDGFVLPNDNFKLKGSTTLYIREGMNKHTQIGKNPKIGDIRIRYEVIYAGEEYSIIAMQKDNSFAPFTTPEGNQINMLEKGMIPANEMFEDAQQGSNFMTRIFSFLALIALVYGGYLVYQSRQN